MEKKHVIILGGKPCRIEVTIGVLRDYCIAQGSDSLAAIDKIRLATFNEAESLLFACLKEGARMDGKALSFEQADLFGILKPYHLTQFVEIFQQQCQIADDEIPKKKKWRWPRKRKKTPFVSKAS